MVLGWDIVRLGCLGCLTFLVAGVLVGGGAWGAFRALQEPELPPVSTTEAEGIRGQKKLVEVIRRGSARRGGDGEPIVLSEQELNAFLSRHLAEAAELPLREIRVHLPATGVVEFGGRLPLRHLVREPPLSSLAGSIPTGWLESNVWLQVRVRPRIERAATRSGRLYLRLDVVGFAVGRLPLPTLLARLLLDPATLGVLRWPVPAGVESVTIEPGRVVIRTAS